MEIKELYYCSNCGEEFDTADECLYHEKENHTFIYCKYCYAQFNKSDREELEKHILDYHKGCESCKLRIDKQVSIKGNAGLIYSCELGFDVGIFWNNASQSRYNVKCEKYGRKK